jgi:RNA polymerase sigma-70 factor (ECF subfamily)
VASLSFLSSESLVKACVGSSDEAAWAEFIRRFQPLIGKVVARMTRRQWPQAPAHLLDDLIQETYLKLCADDCQLLRQFKSRHQDSMFGFLKVVAASVVLDHFKAELAHKRDASQTDTLSEQGALERPVPAYGGRLSMEDKIALRQIDDIVGTHYVGDMLVRNRAIFWLHYRDGMTAQAIASIGWINLSTKGVETTLRKMKYLIQSHIGTSQ